MTIQSILAKLNETMTDYQIAVAIGSTQATVNRIRRGVHKTTTWETGEKIVALAKEKRLDIK